MDGWMDEFFLVRSDSLLFFFFHFPPLFLSLIRIHIDLYLFLSVLCMPLFVGFPRRVRNTFAPTGLRKRAAVTSFPPCRWGGPPTDDDGGGDGRRRWTIKGKRSPRGRQKGGKNATEIKRKREEEEEGEIKEEKREILKFMKAAERWQHTRGRGGRIVIGLTQIDWADGQEDV